MTDKLRAWWWHRQGLDGSLAGKTPAEVLLRAGWARSVGGVGPYVTMFSRAGIARAAADEAVASVAIHELPAARGCTYVLPAADFAVGLTVAQPFGDAELKVAARLGVTPAEVEKLCTAVEGAIGDTPTDPDGIKEKIGKVVRNLGEEGKKKGMITTLPLALGILQAKGLIRRVPVDGRLDQQRYKYVRWSRSPLAKSKLTVPQAHAELARRFFSWVGPATLREFAWFSGLGVTAAKDAVAPLHLVSIAEASDRFLLPEDKAAFETFKASKDPDYKLVSSLDSISAARRDVSTLVDDKDRAAMEKITFGDKPGGNLTDLAAHAIFDRGRLIGYWEFDSAAQEIVWMLFGGKKTRELQRVVEEMQDFIRTLGDARSFSLDSPKSRAPKIAAMRKM